MSPRANPHRAVFRVYYEDTDAGGIVYYANYLKFAERARTEWLRTLGFEQSALLAQEGIAIVVRRCEIDFLAPARLDDQVAVETRLQDCGKVRMTMRQALTRDGRELALVTVTLACIGRDGKPTRWPPPLVEALGQ